MIHPVPKVQKTADSMTYRPVVSKEVLFYVLCSIVVSWLLVWKNCSRGANNKNSSEKQPVKQQKKLIIFSRSVSRCCESRCQRARLPVVAPWCHWGPNVHIRSSDQRWGILPLFCRSHPEISIVSCAFARGRGLAGAGAGAQQQPVTVMFV